MKTYPLVIEPIYELRGNGQPMRYFSRGHHDYEAFIGALCAYLDSAAWVGRPVQHSYYRVVPLVDLSFYAPCDQPGRGAFPVTLMEAY